MPKDGLVGRDLLPGGGLHGSIGTPWDAQGVGTKITMPTVAKARVLPRQLVVY